MVDNDLLSISVRNGAEEITLRRPDASNSAATVVSTSNVQTQLSVDEAKSMARIIDPADSDVGLLTITSPMVGTFYSSPQPGAPLFVKVGSGIRPDTIVCLIEAMKVFNEIPAEVTGTIEKVLVANEQPIEFGQPLFRVRPE